MQSIKLMHVKILVGKIPHKSRLGFLVSLQFYDNFGFLNVQVVWFFAQKNIKQHFY